MHESDQLVVKFPGLLELNEIDNSGSFTTTVFLQACASNVLRVPRQVWYSYAWWGRIVVMQSVIWASSCGHLTLSLAQESLSSIGISSWFVVSCVWIENWGVVLSWDLAGSKAYTPHIVLHSSYTLFSFTKSACILCINRTKQKSIFWSTNHQAPQFCFHPIEYIYSSLL